MEDKQNKPEYEERDASFDPDPTPEINMSDEELQETILSDSGMNTFQKTIARMSDRNWNICQYIAGAVLGLLTSAALFWDTLVNSGNEESGFSYSLIVAVLLAIVVPNVLEKQGLRKIPKLRISMVIALAVCIVAYFLIMGLRSGFNFRA